MSSRHFLEVVLLTADFRFAGRDVVEGPLDVALQDAALGEVTGGGSGMGRSNIDVEVTDIERGLSLLRKVLKSIGVAHSTTIKQYEPVTVVHQVYE